MPVYNYECECGEKGERFVHNANNKVECEKCKATMKQKGSLHFSAPAGKVTRYSESMGVGADQVAEHRRVHPEIQLTEDGRVVTHSLAERRRVMKKLGMRDHKAFY